MDEKRLQAFEEMLQAVQWEYQDIETKMDRLKAEGKVKSATYKQLFGRKMTRQNMLEMYKLYGIL